MRFYTTDSYTDDILQGSRRDYRRQIIFTLSDKNARWV
jgi:hypothetical protein